MNFPRSSKHYCSRWVAFVPVALLALSVKADMIELTNGDHYRGIVISMSSTNLEFLSEIQGRVRLPRDKIAQITLHEVVGKPTAVTAAPAAPTVNQPLIISGAGNPAPATQSDAVVQQMRQQGVDPKVVAQVQEQIFGKSSPEAAQQFNDMMGGLLSGRISMQDIRAKAQSSIAQIRAAKKEFGDDAGDMLDGYLGILEKFVQESATDTTIPTPTTTAPPAVTPVPIK